MRAPSMLGFLTPIVLLTLPSMARAGWTSDVWTDVPVCTANNSQDNSVAVPDGSGGVIVAWEDSRTGSPGIYAQHLDAYGNPQWAIDGVLLSNVAGIYLDAAPDGAGGAFVAWVDSNLSRVQHVNADGVPQWAAGGEPANAIPGDQRSTKVVADLAGGAFVVWQDYRSGWSYHIYAQHFDPAGNLQWGSGNNGLLISASADWSLDPQVDRTPAGDLLVAWYAGGALKASCHSAATSASVWPFTSVVAADTLGTSSDWKMVSDGAGGMVLAFLKNPDRVYATRIDSTGTRAWPTDVPVGTLASASPIELLRSPTHGAYVCWRDTRNGSSGSIAVQHLDSAGTPLWPANGVVVEGTWCTYTGHGLCSDGDAGVVVEWQGTAGLLAQRVDASGTPLWSPGGELVVAGAGATYGVNVVGDGGGGAIAAYTWVPTLGSTDIRAERVNSNGSPGSPTSAPLGAIAPGRGVTAYPNPFQVSTTVELSGVRAGEAHRVDVVDVTGRRIRSLEPQPQGDRLAATWDGRDGEGRRVPAGVYFVRDSASGVSGRVIRLR